MGPVTGILTRPAAALLIVAGLAALPRFAALTRPPELMFDEIYYMKDACLYAGYDHGICRIKSDDERYWVRERGEVGSWVHPPLGKWMIASGELLFGATPFGWRVAAAAFGTLTAVLTAAMAWLLFRRIVWVYVAGLLLAVEGMHVVMSRVAMLDVFLAFWVALGFFLLLLDRRWIRRRDAARSDNLLTASPDEEGVSEAPPASPVWRPWRLAAGAALGAAVATKWSGAWALLGGLTLSCAWERTRRARAGVRHPVWRSVVEEGFGIFLFLVVVPALVYAAAWARWWTLNGLDVAAWARLHLDMAEFHVGLDRLKDNGKLLHAYTSTPWTWPLGIRPVNFFFEDEGTHVVSLGNLAILWSSLLSVPYALLMWWRRRDPAAGFLCIATLSQYLPWFAFSGRVQFNFYLLPLVPFLVLAACYGLRDLSDYRPEGARAHPFRPVAIGFVVTAVALFVFFYPVLTAFPLSSDAWQARMWFPSWV
jgi:dolichyl-phosphate-mannose--protein O-mannosyl transferase